MTLQKIHNDIYTFEFTQKIMPGVYFPARSTIVQLDEQRVAVIAPGPFDMATVEEISQLGKEFFIIAPNLFHHFYFLKAKELFANSQLFAPQALGKKVKKIRGHYQSIEQLPATVTDCLKPKSIQGNKVLQEWVFYHHKSKTLILTDLVFNMQDKPFLTRMMLKSAGAYNRVAQSRLIKLTINDRQKFSESVKNLGSLDTNRIILAHGDIVSDNQIWHKFLSGYEV